MLWITIQALFNASMSLGLLPTKGVPLPFFSFGGSSLVATLLAVGILLNVSRKSQA
ncbi:MAG: FtsW/RodA/SpoVE family cell cycle protein [Elusimicrobia bacterium]|nr:FtsW/RodA/SpoVE family cell cycle protein [Elusimicrobiota bacterium]